jgi:hypothetical protein
MNREQYRRWPPVQPSPQALSGHRAALYREDRRRLDELLQVQTPADGDLVDLARLRMRYTGETPFADLKEDLARLTGLWGFSSQTLYALTRDLWARGWRPVAADAAPAAVGSGADAFAEG